MVNYYQPFLLPFLGLKRHLTPTHVKRYYYHSWEDALWELLRKKQIPLGSTILFPNFYCMDVLENVAKHGYKWQLYELDKNFQSTPQILVEAIHQHEPRIVILFHACGITTNLLKQTDWIKSIPPETIIIEDCVHRLTNPKEVELLNDNHFVMDSLRKDSPLPGSFIYGTHKGLNYKQSNQDFSTYQISSTMLFILFRLTFLLSQLLNSGKLSNFAHHTLLKAHDDIIGDSWKSYPGLPWIPFIHSFINFEKIEKLKTEQAKLYTELLKELFTPDSQFYKINIPESDYGKLHVYPLGLKHNRPEKLIEYLNKHNLNIWTKFPDCPWSEDKSVLFLPLGFHIHKKDIVRIMRLIKSYDK